MRFQFVILVLFIACLFMRVPIKDGTCRFLDDDGILHCHGQFRWVKGYIINDYWWMKW